MKKQILFLLIFFAGFTAVHAQLADLGKGFKKDKKSVVILAKAEEYYENQSYLQALPLYRSLEPLYGTNSYLIYKIGICLLYKSDEIDKALEYLLLVKTKNPKAADIDLFLAKGYHLNERFDEAIASLDAFDLLKDNSPARITESGILRQYCTNARGLVSRPVDAKITNLGAPVNTDASEYVPVVSTDDSIMLFTYRGENSIGGLQSYPGIADSSGIYFEDVVFTSRYGKTWQPPEAMDSTINGNGHDACVGISNDGQTLLIYKDEAGGGDLYVSTMQGFYWSAPVPLRGEVNSIAWEGSASFSADMHTLYFSSERVDGYGGRDIWMATLKADSTWGNIKNLGSKINTSFNEDAPFLHPNGVTLIFSSEGHNSMGGYDIFRTDLTPIDSTFSDASEPINIGYPINTPGDDKYFVLATDGQHGYYSSGKTGGFGQQDIYEVVADFELKNSNVMLVTGIITLDGKPIQGGINIVDQQGKLRKIDLYSKEYTGRYTVTLNQGHNYNLTYTLEGYVSQNRSIESVSREEMQTKIIDIQFFSSHYLDSAKRSDSISSARLVRIKEIRAKIDTSMFKTFPLDSITLQMLDPWDYDLVLRKYGSAKAPGLIFKVQIAAYNFPLNYNYDRLTALGSIETQILDDKITRFTMGRFETLGEAEEYRKKIMDAGQTDAFVTAELQGRRYTMRELVLRHFFQPEFESKY